MLSNLNLPSKKFSSGNNMTSTIFKELQCNLLTQWEKVDLKADRKTLRSLVQWKNKHPYFDRVGRSATYILKKPIYVSEPDYSIESVKIKGVGVRINSSIILQPTSISVENPNPHWGIGKNSEFIPIKSSSAPIGGITISRAVREFEIAKHLFNHSCPSVIPLQVYQYTDPGMYFMNSVNEPEPLGVVITGFSDRICLRADSIFNYHKLSVKEKEIIDSWADKLGINGQYNKQINLISAVSKLYGKTIRKFSESGLYRYSGAPDNYSYSLKTGKVFLIDLDSVGYISDLDNEDVISLEIIRDAASGIAYLLAFLTDPKLIGYFPEQDVINLNPFRELLMGYFNEVDQNYIEEISLIIIDYYKKVRLKSKSMDREKKFNIDIPNNVEQFKNYLSNSYMRPWISRGDTFSYLMPLCCLLYQKSDLRYFYKLSLKIEDVIERIDQLTYSSKNFISVDTLKQLKTDIKHFI